jgi:hypothetical protein
MILWADKITITGREIKLISKGDGFIEVFYSEVKKNQENSYIHIYRVLEEEHMDLVGQFRYPSYEAFTKAKNRFLKKRTKKFN